MKKDFTIGRTDGRSNQQVVIDLVKNFDVPGTVFTFEAIQIALNDGASRRFEITDVRCVVRAALRRLERECQRTLMNVRGVGYRLALAKEHLSLALKYEDKGNRQVKHALSVLQNVKLEEMDDNSRLAHQGTWMLMSALFSQQNFMMRRQRAQETAIAALKSRLG